MDRPECQYRKSPHRRTVAPNVAVTTSSGHISDCGRILNLSRQKRKVFFGQLRPLKIATCVSFKSLGSSPRHECKLPRLQLIHTLKVTKFKSQCQHSMSTACQCQYSLMETLRCNSEGLSWSRSSSSSPECATDFGTFASDAALKHNAM